MSSPNPVNVTVTELSQGASWLSVSAGGTTTPLSISITAKPAGLLRGVYTGSIIIVPLNPADASALTIPVTMTITGPPTIAWLNTSTHQGVYWYQGGPAGNEFQTWQWLYNGNPVPGWHIVGTGDFNGDGIPDLVWQNDTTRLPVVWYMTGQQENQRSSWAWLAPNVSAAGVAGWSIRAVADFNRDGRPDLVWVNDSTRQVVIWYMTGAPGQPSEQRLRWDWVYNGVGAPGWNVVGAGDFNGDHVPDLVWMNDSTRQVVVWIMGGGGDNNQLQYWEWISANPVPGWTAIGAADFDGDGYMDIAWANDVSHSPVIWYMGQPGGQQSDVIPRRYWAWVSSNPVTAWWPLVVP